MTVSHGTWCFHRRGGVVSSTLLLQPFILLYDEGDYKPFELLLGFVSDS